RWFTLFTMYRYSLVERLTEIHKDQGFSPTLLAPAMIDFSRWLGEDVASPLEDQVTVMARISRKYGSPAVHGYVAFDPLREVYYRRHLLKQSSLELGSRLIKATIQEQRRGKQRPGNSAPACRSGLRCA